MAVCSSGRLGAASGLAPEPQLGRRETSWGASFTARLPATLAAGCQAAP